MGGQFDLPTLQAVTRHSIFSKSDVLSISGKLDYGQWTRELIEQYGQTTGRNDDILFAGTIAFSVLVVAEPTP